MFYYVEFSDDKTVAVCDSKDIYIEGGKQVKIGDTVSVFWGPPHGRKRKKYDATILKIAGKYYIFILSK